MTKEEILAWFPKKAKITQEIINEAKLYRSNLCIGALTLKTILPDEYKDKASWGIFTSFGTFPKDNIVITTDDNVDMMMVKEPREVTFIIKQ